MKARLWAIKKDIHVLLGAMNKLKERVKKLLEDWQKFADQMCGVADGRQENIFKQFKEVNKLLGAADTEITIFKVSLSSLGETCQDKKVLSVVNAQKMDPAMNLSVKGVEEKCKEVEAVEEGSKC